MESIQKLSHYIEDWLTKYIKKSKMKGFVVGVSGGIDSAVTSTICARTGYPTLCLNGVIKMYLKFLKQENISSG